MWPTGLTMGTWLSGTGWLSTVASLISGHAGACAPCTPPGARTSHLEAAQKQTASAPDSLCPGAMATLFQKPITMPTRAPSLHP